MCLETGLKYLLKFDFNEVMSENKGCHLSISIQETYLHIVLYSNCDAMSLNSGYIHVSSEVLVGKCAAKTY